MRRALALLAAVALGLLVGRISAPDSVPSPLGAESRDPTREEVGGLGAGYPHTREGAILAGAHYQQALADRSVLRPAELRRRIRAIATAEFAPVMLAANQPGAARLRRGELGQGLRAGVPSAFFGVPVAYRVLSYSPRGARIQSWGFTLIGNASSVEPRAYFGLSRMELVWIGGEWRVAETRASFGPTPRPATPRHGGEGFGLIDLVREMRPYAVGP
jgi:hypothetical protein